MLRNKLLALALALLPLAAAADTTITGPITFGTGLTVTGSTVTAFPGGGAAACSDLSDGGTACTADTGTSGATLPFLNGTNTFSGTQTFGTVLGTVRTVTGTTHTIEASDCGKNLLFTNGSAVTLTTLNSIFPGCAIAVEQGGAGTVTVAAGAGTTLRSASSTFATSAQYNIIGLSVDTNSGGSSANFVVTGAAPAALANSALAPSNPTGTTSLTGVMMGLAGSITPARTGNVLVFIKGSLRNNTASRGCTVFITYGTGSAPANGDALTGTQVGGESFTDGMAANSIPAFTADGLITGLTPATAYWIDVSLAARTSGTCTLFSPVITAVEQP